MNDVTDIDSTPASLVPLLVVRDASRAIGFYEAAFGARELTRFVHPDTAAVSHADLVIGGAALSVTEEARGWNSDAPPSLGGSPVVLQLRVADVGALVASATQAGAEVVVALVELFGERMARLRDPFGHLWLVSQRLETLSVDEIRRRRDAFAEQLRRVRSPTAELEAASTLPVEDGAAQAPPTRLEGTRTSSPSRRRPSSRRSCAASSRRSAREGYSPFGSQSSTRLPSQSTIHAKRPKS